MLSPHTVRILEAAYSKGATEAMERISFFERHGADPAAYGPDLGGSIMFQVPAIRQEWVRGYLDNYPTER